MEKIEIQLNSANKSLPPLVMKYKNWRGVTSTRKIIPDYIWFGVTQYHQNLQWLLHALDAEKNEYRDFALADIIKIIR